MKSFKMIRLAYIGVFSVFIGITASHAAVLATLRGEAKAFPTSSRRVFEKPLYQVAKGDVVEIVRWGTPLTQVRSKTGRLGWIESANLDTIHIPAILSLTAQSAKPAALTASDDSAVAKRWMAAQKNIADKPSAVEKSLDFPKDSAHITPRTQQDSAKK